jgi:hypothetical protein
MALISTLIIRKAWLGKTNLIKITEELLGELLKLTRPRSHAALSVPLKSALALATRFRAIVVLSLKTWLQ